MNWRENKIIYRAFYESRSFTFEAYSTEELHAKICLIDVLESHGKQYECEPCWWGGNLDDLSIQKITLGVGYRDGEEVRILEKEET
jgi:hypothetical protein